MVKVKASSEWKKVEGGNWVGVGGMGIGSWGVGSMRRAAEEVRFVRMVGMQSVKWVGEGSRVM